MMQDAIKKFPTQFSFQPVVENGPLGAYDQFIVCGMGGSHLAGDLLKMIRPERTLAVHSDYGLPPISEQEIARTLVIASSYSGNTEETLDSYNAARTRGMAVAVISTGGALLQKAQQDGVPYVRLPDTGIQPRQALGFGMRDGEALAKSETLTTSLNAEALEAPGKELALRMRGFVPVIYSSWRNSALAYNWKIKFNETGKIPAFYNVLPELNHNEMTGFDVREGTRALSQKFYFVFLKDTADRPRTQKRMAVLERLYRERGLLVEVMPLAGENDLLKMFSSLVLADWAAYHTALGYGAEPEQVPMVEEFKKLILG